MSCPICRRSSCIASFHSLEEQAQHDARQTMSDDVDTLRRQLQDAQDEIVALREQLDRIKDDAQDAAWERDLHDD